MLGMRFDSCRTWSRQFRLAGQVVDLMRMGPVDDLAQVARILEISVVKEESFTDKAWSSP
jgi:hypothetical protein